MDDINRGDKVELLTMPRVMWIAIEVEGDKVTISRHAPKGEDRRAVLRCEVKAYEEHRRREGSSLADAWAGHDRARWR
jgi:hypothetical protein